MEYEEDIKIDENALDVEWLEQPRLMIQYAKYSADMQKRYEQAKEQLELVQAELDREIRSNPDEFGISKINNDVVANTIKTTQRYQDASDEVIEARYEYEMAKSVVRAFDARKDALENLVKLHGQQYFAGPSAPRDISKEWENRQKDKRSNKEIGSKMKRKDK